MGVPDSLQQQAVEMLSEQLAADRVPSIRAIRSQFHIGQPRAQLLCDCLATEAERRPESSAA